MTIRTNLIMDTYLEKIGYSLFSKNYELPDKLIKIIMSSFIHADDGCTTLESINDHVMKKGTDYERTEWEDFQNHFHPDFYNPSEDDIDYLKMGLECAEILAIRLQHEFPQKNFRLDISFSETTYEKDCTEIEFHGSSRVSFYEIRESVENIFKVDDLNSYTLDAVMSIEV